jgi:apolipoprotein N-acyltransferase
MIDPTPSAPPSGDGSSGARWLAAAVAGLVLAASFPPFGWGICAWFALVPLLWALADARPGAAAGRGYLCGLLFMAGVGYFTTSFGGEVFWMRVLPWVLFTAIEALYFIPIALALSAILQRGQTWAVLLGVPAVWAVGEWARGAGSLGFPFGMLGYALHDESGVIQAAALGGVYLVSALAAMVSTGLYLLLFGGFAVRRPVLLSLSAVVIVVLWGLGVVSREQDNAHLAP